jgi:rfaE bifunctional protein nucleotidyltransferase chain/domain
MEFIIKTSQENEICIHSPIRTRENSNPIDYLNKVNDKPWGKEYLAYQNQYIGIWILHVNKNQETSLHCHFKKDTILIPICGTFKINLFQQFSILNIFESIYVPRNTFHGIHSYIDNGILMEIEIYTENIRYTDKNDLLRIKDMYNRDKTSYEKSVVEREPFMDEIMLFNKRAEYNIDNNTNIKILNFGANDVTSLDANKHILLEGAVFMNGNRLGPGSFIEPTHNMSVLTNNISVLSLSNINTSIYSKVIYSKEHLRDFTLKNKHTNIGLTSGCFDILHEGHITNLKMCKKTCTKLFVCLSSDVQIKRLKGSSRPVNNLIDRLKMLASFDFIDYIILYDEIDDETEFELDNIINILEPATWFKGGDYNKKQILDKHPSIKDIVIIPLVNGKSTTNIINKIAPK